MSKENHNPASPYLAGKLLLAMPSLGDPRFHHAVIFMCQHDENGAVGLVINHAVPNMNFGNLIDQLEFDKDMVIDPNALKIPLMHGGPVDGGRGFILHDASYAIKDTILVDDHFAVTSTLPILKQIAQGKGPERLIFVLGYAGWEAGQLDAELKQNAWLTADATADILFETKVDHQWNKALAQLGINPAMLSGTAGSA
ncbi:MAG: YqgE/AlgH family protein [Alphaproteobacteria bacterium]